MIKQIIFDFDGTLIDSLDIFIKIGNHMVEKYGYTQISEDRIKKLLVLPMKERIESLGIPIYKLAKIGAEALKLFNEKAAAVKPINGMREVLGNLHMAGYGLNIVSSNTGNNIDTFLKANDLCIFDNIQSSKGLFGKHTTISKLITKLGVKKEEVIYIGDEQRDIDACKKVGIQIISVLWGFDSLELIQQKDPEFIVAEPQEIIEVVKGIK